MKNLLFTLLVLVLLTACGKEKCDYDACNSGKAPDSEIQSLQAYLQSNNITATQHCSGMFYIIQERGSGKQATACSDVAVRYRGTLTNGNVFDETGPQDPPAAFNVGGLIPGFKNGLIQLKAGGRITMYIPPTLGYGNRQAGSIPPNSVLIFTVDLLEVE